MRYINNMYQNTKKQPVIVLAYEDANKLAAVQELAKWVYPSKWVRTSKLLGVEL